MVHAAVLWIEAMGIPSKRVAVIGFSQGGATAAMAALTQRGLLTFGMLGGWLLPHARQAAPRAPIRAFVAHGTADAHVSYDCFEHAVALLQATPSLNLTHVSFEGVAHGQVVKAALPHLARFLDESFAIA